MTTRDVAFCALLAFLAAMVIGVLTAARDANTCAPGCVCACAEHGARARQVQP